MKSTERSRLRRRQIHLAALCGVLHAVAPVVAHAAHAGGARGAASPAASPAGPHLVFDGTLGHGGAIPASNGNYDVAAGNGKQVGPNLFHSFSQFNLSSGEVATFSGPTSVHTVLTRVTGGSPSAINGTIRCTIPDASFFLINPSGVIFGPNAALDVKGSFAVTTADVVKLADGGAFHAANPSASVLTSAPPAAFGFLAATPQAVGLVGTTVKTSALVVPAGKDLTIAAGPVALSNALVQAPGGRVNVAAVAGPGDVTTDPADAAGSLVIGASQPRAAVALSQSQINPPFSRATPGQGGSVAIGAGDLTLDHSTISAETSAGPGASPADVNIDLTGGFSSIAGQVSAVTANDTPGGSVRVRAADVSFDGAGATAGLVAATGGPAIGGDIQVTAGTVLLKAGSTFVAAGTRAGPSGQVHIVANSVTLDGNGTPAGQVTGLLAGSTGTDATAANARGGDVRVDAKQVTLTRGAQINVSAAGTTDGGTIFLNTDTLTMSDGGAISSSTSSIGNAGTVDINATGAVKLSGGSQILSLTNGPGNGGMVFLDATDVVFDGAAAEGVPSGINLQAGMPSASGGTVGKGGSATLAVNSLSLLNGAQISVSTLGVGDAGSAAITAVGTVLVSGFSATTAGVSSSRIQANTFGAAHGGSISVDAARIQLDTGGQIQAATTGNGDAGSIMLHGGEILLDRAGSAQPTGVSAATGALGALGNPGPLLNTAATGRGADVTIAANSLSVRNGAFVAADSYAHGAGGNINITTAGGVRVDGSYTDAAGNPTFSALAADAFGAADSRGGNIGVRASQIIVSGGAFVTSSTGNAPGGDVSLTAPGGVVIRGAAVASLTAGMGNAGSVTVTGGDVTLDGPGSGISVASGNATSAFTATAGGAGGKIAVSARTLTATGGAQLKADTTTSGASGDVTVSASDMVLLNGVGGASPSGITASTVGVGAGPAGNVVVRAPHLVLLDGGIISASKANAATGGSVQIDASRSVIVRGVGQYPVVPGQPQQSAPFSTIAAFTLGGVPGVDPGAPGNAKGGKGADIKISTPLLITDQGGFVSNTTYGTGDAGNIDVVSHRVILSGRSAVSASGLGAETRSYNEPGPGVVGAGNAGSVSVDVGRTGSVQLYKGAGISTRSTSTGKGGNIDVKGGNLVIDSRGFREIPPFVVNFNTGILARGEAAGAGGDIHVAVGRLRLLNQGGISAATAAANQRGGDITLSADDAGLYSGTITTNSAGTGGNIDLTASRQLYLRRSTITATAGGDGGRISIDPPAIALADGSLIDGISGGKSVIVKIQGDLLIDRSRILTNTPQNFPTFDIAGALLALHVDLNASIQPLPNVCAVGLGSQDVSSFVVTGRGGVAPEPSNWQPDPSESGPGWTLSLTPQREPRMGK